MTSTINYKKGFPMHKFSVALAALLAIATAGTMQQAVAASSESAPSVVSTINGDLRIERLAALEFPWGMALMPDGGLLVTENPGRLRIFKDGKLSEPIENVPTVSYSDSKSEQGGLLDVVLDPDFAQNKRIYLSYSEAAEKQPESLADTGDVRFGDYLDQSDDRLRGGVVARATLDGNRLSNVETIWRQTPKTVGRGHFGHRLIFADDGKLFITSGERGRFEPAQSHASNLGKVVRINTDGSIPQDNPFANKKDAQADIWSLGHRNIISAALHPDTKQLWAWEMGPLGGDEMNIVEQGKNYGWPAVSNGAHYDNSTIPPHPARPQFEAPVRTWTPVLSPSGALFYQGSLLPWRGDAIVGGLSSKALIRQTFDGRTIKNEERIDMQHRIRDLIEAPDGSLLVITDEKDGELLRLTPASGKGETGNGKGS